MKRIRSCLPAAFLISCLAGMHASAQTAPIVVSTAHGRPPSEVTISYGAQCAGAGFELRFLKKSAQVQFIVKDGAERVFDISGTRFGQTFLHKHLYGNFDMGCGKGVFVHFLGVQLQRTGQPRVMRYYFSIGKDGTVFQDDGPVEEDVDEIDRLIDR